MKKFSRGLFLLYGTAAGLTACGGSGGISEGSGLGLAGNPQSVSPQSNSGTYAKISDSDGYVATATISPNSPILTSLVDSSGSTLLTGRYSVSMGPTIGQISHTFAFAPLGSKVFNVAVSFPLSLSATPEVVDGITYALNADGSTSASVLDSRGVTWVFNQDTSGNLSITNTENFIRKTATKALYSGATASAASSGETETVCKPYTQCVAAVAAWASVAMAVGAFTAPIGGEVLIGLGAVGAAAAAVGAFGGAMAGC